MARPRRRPRPTLPQNSGEVLLPPEDTAPPDENVHRGGALADVDFDALADAAVQRAADAAVARASAVKVRPCSRCGINTSNTDPRDWCRPCYDESTGDGVGDPDDAAAAV